ncbi:MAG TPA: hypothetical protein VFG62_19995 [Rhodopila sp.]|jgi:hypothetical protein|nr:hypothetical protein [Rhodopila sp.]
MCPTIRSPLRGTSNPDGAERLLLDLALTWRGLAAGGLHDNPPDAEQQFHCHHRLAGFGDIELGKRLEPFKRAKKYFGTLCWRVLLRHSGGSPEAPGLSAWCCYREASPISNGNGAIAHRWHPLAKEQLRGYCHDATGKFIRSIGPATHQRQRT